MVLIIESMHLINLHFWTYLVQRGKEYDLCIQDASEAITELCSQGKSRKWSKKALAGWIFELFQPTK